MVKNSEDAHIKGVNELRSPTSDLFPFISPMWKSRNVIAPAPFDNPLLDLRNSSGITLLVFLPSRGNFGLRRRLVYRLTYRPIEIAQLLSAHTTIKRPADIGGARPELDITISVDHGVLNKRDA